MPNHRIDFGDPRIVAEVITKLVDNTPVAYLILDKNLRVHYVNDYYLKLRNLEKNQILGNYCFNVTNNGAPCTRCAVRDAIQSGKRELLTRKDIMPDGTTNYIDEYAIPLYDENGSYDYILEVMINRTNEMLLRENNDRVFLGLIETFTSMLGKKDSYTSNHSHDVTEISVKLAEYIGLEEQELTELRLASLIHDIGKIYIPDSIINKKTALTEDEYRIIKRHPIEILNMLRDLGQFAGIRAQAGYHHERWDGTGYPFGLKGEDIPLGARIIAIADTYDAMTSTRSYRQALPHRTALNEIRDNAGGQFDPTLARQFVELAETVFNSRERLIQDDGTRVFRRSKTQHSIERQIPSQRRDATRVFYDRKVQKFMTDDMFAKAIMDSSPCHYMIIDTSFNLLFASDSIAKATGVPHEQLHRMRCFDIDNRGMSCFGVNKKGKQKCPAVRAFFSGQGEAGRIVRTFNGRDLFCDVYAVPVTVHDTDGNPMPCLMEILLDRTNEVQEREAMKGDVRTLLALLLELVANLDSQTTQRFDDIIKECTTFSEYLSTIGKIIQNMLDADRDEEETVVVEFSNKAT